MITTTPAEGSHQLAAIASAIPLQSHEIKSTPNKTAAPTTREHTPKVSIFTRGVDIYERCRYARGSAHTQHHRAGGNVVAGGKNS